MAVIKTVTVIFEVDETILSGESISLGIQTNSSEGTLSEVFRFIRSGNNQTTIGGDAVSSALNYNTSLNLDGSLFGIETSIFGNSVTISLSDDTYYFTTITGTLIDNGRVTVNTTTEEPIVDRTLNLDSYTSFVGDVCGKTNAIINATGGDGTFDIYVDEVLTSSNQTSPITLPLSRGATNVVRVVESNGITVGTLNLKPPRKLSTTDISFIVTNLTAGTNLQGEVNFISEYTTPYEYSLDNITYQESNLFPNLPNGDYTFYVKDAFGCVVSKNVTINGETQVVETIFDISDINPIRFAKYSKGKKNYQNTLSCNDLRRITTQFIHNYLETDTIKTQFKTNASYINVFTIDENLNTNTLSTFKQTSNTGLISKSTCTYFNIGDGRSAIYFGIVDILDPIDDTVISTDNFGFTLPIWANKEGKYVIIEGIGEVQIDSIGYSETYESFVIEFNIPYSGEPIEKTLLSNYNLQPYEVYETELVMSNEPEEFNLVIQVGTDSDNIDFTYISEKIKRVEDNKFLFEIDYWSTKNVNKFVYQTGIRNKIRLNGWVSYIGEQSTEGYDGDKEYYVTDNTVYHSEKFSFFGVSNEIAHKLRLIFTSEELYINGIKYNLSDIPEVPQKEGNSNLKNFFVTLKSSGNLTLEDVSEQIDNTSQSLELESLIAINKDKGGLLWTKTF